MLNPELRMRCLLGQIAPEPLPVAWVMTCHSQLLDMPTRSLLALSTLLVSLAFLAGNVVNHLLKKSPVMKFFGMKRILSEHELGGEDNA